MAAACWGLGQATSGARGWRLSTILLFAALFRVSLLPTEPSLSDDLYRYIWDGRVQLAGVSPYRHAPEDPALGALRDPLYHKINHRSVRSIYPPTSQLVFRLFATVAPGVLGFKLGLCALELMAVALLARLLVMLGRSVAPLPLYAWNPLVVVETAASGHAESLAALLLMLGLTLLLRQRRVAAGALLGAAILAKLYPAFCAPAWLPSLRRPGLLALVGSSVLISALYWTGDLTPVAGLTTFTEHWNHNEFVYRLLLAASPDRDVAKLAAAGLYLAAAAALLWRASGEELDRLAAGSLWLLFWMLCLSPTVHPWYVSWLGPWLVLWPRLGPLIWTATVPLTYEILLGYRATGVWEEKAWVVAAEYVPVCAALLADAAMRRGRVRSRSTRLSSPT